MSVGVLPTRKLDWLSVREALGVATGKYTIFEGPPPTGGFTTVMAAVPAVATLDAGTVAVNFEPLTKVVTNATPFQSTVAPLTKPVPFTVKVKVELPGATVSGIRG